MPQLTNSSLAVFGKLIILVSFIILILRIPLGKKIGRFVPIPFWIYFFSMLLGFVGLFPATSSVYGDVETWLLPAALFLLLIGTPVQALLKMGPRCGVAMLLAVGSMITGVLVSFLILSPFLSGEAWKAAGALLATWVGGSANMLSVKEILGLTPSGLAPVVVIDTFLSYAWMAFLLLGAGLQVWFNQRNGAHWEGALEDPVSSEGSKPKAYSQRLLKMFQNGGVLLVGLLTAGVFIFLGNYVAKVLPFLSAKAWVILMLSLATVGLSMSPLKKLERWGASHVGATLLFVVLATIGARTPLSFLVETPIYFLFGFITLAIHGGLLFWIGWGFKIPLVILATASQANVGGVVSAPIVAEAYQRGTSYVGVLMAVLGILLGTYVGLMGAFVCRYLGG